MTPELKNKRVLITGGTGSFGRTVAKELLKSGVSEVRIFSRDEAKQDEMRVQFSDQNVGFHIGDVRDFESVYKGMRDIDFVFHAAALKQVPSCEFFPNEAIRTNVIGSQNVIQAAERRGVSSVVCLSTDKAVYPINAMGMTKALMEKIAQAHGLNNPNSPTTVSCVRYGNVMYSRGSVIPRFISQIREGLDLTITNPDMTRFLMSLDQSVDLVKYAFSNAEQGDIFIRKAPACTVGTLANSLLQIFNSSSGLQIIGTRHAEKLFETLARGEEISRADDLGDFIRIRADSRDLNYGNYTEVGEIKKSESLDYDSNHTDILTQEETVQLLLKLPEISETMSELKNN